MSQSISTYRRQTDLVSISELKLFSFSPFLYKRKYLDFSPNEKKQSDAQLLGELIHCLYLEPDKAAERYIKYEKPNTRTKIGKETHSEALEEAERAGKKLINQDDMSIATVLQFELEKLLPLRGRDEFLVEQELYIKDPNSFCMPVKGQPDLYSVRQNVLYDLKSTNMLPLESDFSSEVLKRKYYWQAAFYIDIIKEIHGLKKDLAFKFIVAQTEYPHAVQIFTLDPEAIECGRQEYTEALTKLKECKDKDWFPKTLNAKPDILIGLPGYYRNKTNQLKAKETKL